MRATPATPRLVDELPPARRCQAVVVGGGLVGLELAAELDRAGFPDVVVLEAGRADDLRHASATHARADALRLWLEPERDACFRQPWRSACPPHYTGSSGLRQRLGGRSLYWYGVALPIEPWALSDPRWPAALVADLRVSWRGGAPLYERLGRQLATWRAGAPARLLADPAPVVTLAGHRLRRTPRAIRPDAAHRDRWYAYSPLDRWRNPQSGVLLRRPRNVRIVTGAVVDEVVVRGGAVEGVLLRDVESGERAALAADHVVLAAGTIESTRLAIQALAAVDPARPPSLGGLVDHMVQGVFVRLDGPAAARLADAIAPGSYFAPGPPDARSNLFLELVPSPGGGLLVDLQATGEQLPSARSRVECEPAARAPWPVSIRSETSPDDRRVLAMQRLVLAEALAQLGRLAGVRLGAPEFDSFDAPRRTNAFVLPERVGAAPPGVPHTWSGYLGTEDHEGGTLALGEVVDERHEVVGISGLLAAGPSTFPRLGAANPALTALALAHRLAAVLTARVVPSGRSREAACA